MSQPTFIDRKVAKFAEGLGDTDPRDLGLLIAVCRAHQKRIALDAERAATQTIDLAAFRAQEAPTSLVQPETFRNASNG